MSTKALPTHQPSGRTIVPPLNGPEPSKKLPSLADFLEQEFRRSLQILHPDQDPEKTDAWLKHAPLLDFFRTRLDNCPVRLVKGDNVARNAMILLETGEQFTFNSNSFALKPAAGHQPPLQSTIPQPPENAGQTLQSTAVPINKQD